MTGAAADGSIPDDARRDRKSARSFLTRFVDRLRSWGDVSRDVFLFVALVTLILVAAIYLAPEDKVVLLKCFAVFYFSLLPAVLYLQFSARRKLSVWREYVLNLYKLGIDDPANLPKPPALSPFYPKWKEAREQAWSKGLIQRQQGESREQVDEHLEKSNLYRQKFRDLFGRIPPLEEEYSLFSIKSTQKLQVVVATVLIAIGWVFVVQPESVFDRSFAPSDFKLANLPTIPAESFAFAFLGAYFYILQMLVRRYFQGDLKSTAYVNATMRIIIVILLVWVIDPLLAEQAGQPARSAVAFAIGVFPNSGWRLIQLAVRKPVGLVVDSLEPTYKLSQIDGLNVWYESRLLEVGVEDMENLTTTDIVDLMLNTRIPVDRLVDWIDQAFLYLRVEDGSEDRREADPAGNGSLPRSPRKLLRSYGIRTASDLLDVLSSKDGSAYANLLGSDGNARRMRALLTTLETERNFRHVRAWRDYAVGKA